MSDGKATEHNDGHDVEHAADVKHVEGQKPVNLLLWNLMLLAG